MKTIDNMKDLLKYCEKEDTYVTGYRDGKCYLDNGEVFKFNKN